MIEIITLGAFVLAILVCGSNASWRFNLDHPFALYATVFAIYEFGPIVAWSLTDNPHEETKWAVLGMALLSLLGIAIGMRLGHGARNGGCVKRHRTVLPQGSLNGTLTIIGALIVLTALRYAILISQGSINTHTNPYVVQPTLFVSVFIVFAAQGRFAAIILLGFVYRSSPDKARPAVFRLLVVYTVILEIVLVTSSETRPALTGVLCFLIALRCARQRPISLGTLAGSAAGILVAALIIQQVRLVDLDTIRLQ